MKKRKIVIIRGKTTGGKSTISYELAKVLPGWIFIDIWKIKEMFEPLELKDRSIGNNTSKKAVNTILKEVIRELRANIILQESTIQYLNKIVGIDLKKYNYEVYSFFLDVDLKNAVKRDIKRKKPTMGIGKKSKDEDLWSSEGPQKKKGDYYIHTGKNNLKQVIDIILEEIGEKGKSHPGKHLLRKSN
jgi:shikimate kinase